MPIGASAIDILAWPPVGTLLPVLDTGGPYSFGSWTFDTFTTGGAGFLPSGTYQVHGTYGVIAVVNGAIPAAWGYDLGLDSGGALGFEGYRYHNRFCQLIPMHQLYSGALWPMDRVDVHYAADMLLWPFRFIGGDRLGLHVSPGIQIDLHYLCVL